MSHTLINKKFSTAALIVFTIFNIFKIQAALAGPLKDMMTSDPEGLYARIRERAELAMAGNPSADFPVPEYMTTLDSIMGTLMRRTLELEEGLRLDGQSVIPRLKEMAQLSRKTLTAMMEMKARGRIMYKEFLRLNEDFARCIDDAELLHPNSSQSMHNGRLEWLLAHAPELIIVPFGVDENLMGTPFPKSGTNLVPITHALGPGQTEHFGIVFHAASETHGMQMYPYDRWGISLWYFEQLLRRHPLLRMNTRKIPFGIGTPALSQHMRRYLRETMPMRANWAREHMRMITDRHGPNGRAFRAALKRFSFDFFHEYAVSLDPVSVLLHIQRIERRELADADPYYYSKVGQRALQWHKIFWTEQLPQNIEDYFPGFDSDKLTAIPEELPGSGCEAPLL